MIRDEQDREARKAQRRAQKREARDAALRNKFIFDSLQTEEGRAYFWWLLSLTRVGANPFTANALTTAFACGEHNVGVQVHSHIMSIAPLAYFQMCEARAKENEDASGRSDSTAAADVADDDDND